MVTLQTTMKQAQRATIDLPGSLDALAELSAWIQDIARDHGLSTRCAFQLELVLAEAVTNIVQYADVAGGDAAIAVELQCAEEGIRIRLEDTGRPFDPTSAPAHVQPQNLEESRIGGLGIHLIRAYTERLEYHRVGNRNRLSMVISCNA